ncbi:MAG: pyridoxal phosphate-dependent aminotransferase [Oscillospiraceae bacterium]|nr:pyridoxal phosphate-dependent aminotransferase [Oscillospiraceae bacterium]
MSSGKYNFDKHINRHGTGAIKYSGSTELIPMWVADMDFSAPPEVLRDINTAVNHGIFGYTEPEKVGNGYYDAVTNWFKSRYNYSVDKKEIVKTPGIVFALAQMVCAFTKLGDSVLIQTPVYYPFFDVIRENGRKLVTNSLLYDGRKYAIDFVAFEKQITENNVKMFIFCNPHNPIGRVWNKFELNKLNDICKAHDVIVISDEIHCDFVYRPHNHLCFGNINPEVIVATAPSKTFNLAGLQSSNIFIKNEKLREKLKKQIHASGYSQLNTLGLIACQSAYQKGELWLSELKSYLTANIDTANAFFKSRLTKIKFTRPESTYLLWLDFSEYGFTQKELDAYVRQKAKLWLSSGVIFGEEGKGFQRMNIACPISTLKEALHRLDQVQMFDDMMLVN